MKRRIFFGALGALCCATAAIVALPAQAQRGNVLNLVVPYPAGGGTDFFARTVAPRMGIALKQTVVVENKPGASGMIAATAVAHNMPADGNTVLLGDTGTYALNPSLYKNLAYNVQKDLAPVGMTARFAYLLVVNPKLLPQVTDVKSLIAEVHKHPDGLYYASPGIGTPHHLVTETFKNQLHLKLTAVVYKGGAPAMQDVIAGQVPLMFLDLATAQQQVRAGTLRAIATASEHRLPQFPNVPTLAESGLPGFSAYAWQGLTVRAGTSKQAIDRINAAYQFAVSDPAVREKLLHAGIEVQTSTPEAFGAYIKSETKRWGDVIRANHISLQ